MVIDSVYVLAMLGAVVTLVGGMVFLFRQKTVVNENGEVTSIEIPLFGKLKSNYPSIGICFIGAALAVAVMARVEPKVAQVAQIGLAAEVGLAEAASASGLPLYVAVVPQEYLRSTTPNAAGVNPLSFEVDSGKAYNVVVLRLAEITEDGRTRYQSTYGPAVLCDDGQLCFKGDLQ